MIKKIRNSKFSKIVACYLVLMIFLQFTQPMVMFALTEGPSQPEFNSFTPIATSDMVDLTSGDFNYNIPIMDVGGYPINLAYNSGVTMDQEASWVGLGWNLNIGQINRNVRGLPDDFKGDEVINENNMKKNLTLSIKPYFNWQLVAIEEGDATHPADTAGIGTMGAGIDLRYNNYRGLSAVPSFGMSFNLSDNVSVGADITSSNEEGVSVTPNVSLTRQKDKSNEEGTKFFGSVSPSITYNSRQGLQSFNLSSSYGFTKKKLDDSGKMKAKMYEDHASSSISFLNTTFTPSVRTPMKNNQFTFSFSTGAEIYGLSGELSIAAGTTIQSLKESTTVQKAYGYEFTDFGNSKSLLDFNREKEQSVVTKNTKLLPLTNYTYDILSIQSQTGGGTFRPYRGQVGMIHDPTVQDVSTSGQASLELEGAQGVHVGGNIKFTKSTTRTGNWKTVASAYFKESASNAPIDYEKVYFKKVGENRVDREKESLLDAKLGGRSPITLQLNKVTNDAMNRYSTKGLSGTSSTLNPMASPILKPIRRDHREKRNAAVQKFTVKEVNDYGMQRIIQPNSFAKLHHTAGYITTEEDGSRQVFGETAYNISKQEVAFAVSNDAQPDCASGLVQYNSGDDSASNIQGTDNYFNRLTTPAYAHTYLLTSVLSTDYEDRTQDGPTPDDFGSYTKFTYTKLGDAAYSSKYNWRVPFEKDRASFNEGFKTDKRDQKGSYLYGSKEIKYVKRIETKTHVAFIDLEPRKDGFGVANNRGGIGTNSVSYKITSIRLFTRAEAEKAMLLDNISGNDDLTVKPIKTATFIYDYSLCQPLTPNSDFFNNNNAAFTPPYETSNTGGKLTLKRVYFTYRDSNMGRFTPYTFEYDQFPASAQSDNYNYNVKNYDVWGNYMPNTACTNPNNLTSPQEFPYVNQDESHKAEQDKYASAWSLKTINLPSGGRIDVTYETDDYQYVQDQKAMRMFKVDGVCGDYANYVPALPEGDRCRLYDGNSANYIAINIGSDQDGETNAEVIARKYTEGLDKKPIYFNFFLNMRGTDNYDYVTGYFEMDTSNGAKPHAKLIGTTWYLFIKAKKINREGKGGGGAPENPIAVSGWFFGRENLPFLIYNQPYPSSDVGANLIGLGKSLLGSLGAMSELLIGANGRLKKSFGCAKMFKPQKSWIRLNEPDGIKYGGGARVKKILMHDEWQEMIGTSNITADISRYKKEYGQQYDYTLEDETSSGVATYEPNVCKENPLVLPFYNGAEKLSIPSYQEKPFGESFFPAATVTYSRVSVKNVTAADDETGHDKTRSGTVITEHYTTKDFPTITDYTDLSKSKDFDTNEPSMLLDLAGQVFVKQIDVFNFLTMTQGFYIETNDMNAKLKKQSVYNNGNQLISSVEYIYSTQAENHSVLDNTLTVVDELGNLSKQEIGTHYDVINDFRESYSKSTTKDINPNVDIIPIGVIPIILGFGVFGKAIHTNILKTAVTTKVVHKCGILKEKIAFDLGARVSTENLAWDGTSGQVLVTKTNNEFDDSYYSVSYPGYWYYDGMGLATNNLGIEGTLNHPVGNNNPYFTLGAEVPVGEVFFAGDEIDLMSFPTTTNPSPYHLKAWVANVDAANNRILLIDMFGNYFAQCGGNTNFRFKITRSGYRNLQMQSMASITTMVNPLDTNYDSTMDGVLFTFPHHLALSKKVINASAIEYSDFWQPQAENTEAQYTQTELADVGLNGGNGIHYPIKIGFNPYLNNYKGDWNAKRSYAYLSGRLNNSGSPRHQGYFKDFNTFYSLIKKDTWGITPDQWTFASEVSQISPYCVEIENRDALDRYSSAQYGYNYNLPMAVSSNSKYRDMGFDGFEESHVSELTNPIDLAVFPHFGFYYENGQPGGAEISDRYSHTGNKSLRVTTGNKAVMLHPLFITDKVREEIDCNPDPNPGGSCPNIYEPTSQAEAQCDSPSGVGYIGLDIDHFPAEPVLINNFVVHSKCNPANQYPNQTLPNWMAATGPLIHDKARLCISFMPSNSITNYTLEFDIHFANGTVQHMYIELTAHYETDENGQYVEYQFNGEEEGSFGCGIPLCQQNN